MAPMLCGYWQIEIIEMDEHLGLQLVGILAERELEAGPILSILCNCIRSNITFNEEEVLE